LLNESYRFGWFVESLKGSWREDVAGSIVSMLCEDGELEGEAEELHVPGDPLGGLRAGQSMPTRRRGYV
jgi:hypothetical protein